MTPLLNISGLHLRYGKFNALNGVDLTIGAGEIVSVIGANGAGKSSLIKAITGAEKDVTGAVRLDGTDILGRSAPHIARMGIAIVPEGRRIFPSLSVEENIVMGAQIGSPPRAGLAGWTLDRVYDLFPDLVEKRHLSGTALSGGQQQMIAIGRALMTNPRVLLCDEVSLGLAPTIIGRLYTNLKTLAENGLAILVVEQAMRTALAVSSRYYCMLEGHVSLSGVSADADENAISRAYFGQ